MKKTFKKDWIRLLSPEKQGRLEAILEQLKTVENCFPPQELMLHALDYFQPEACRVVLVGQDPYHKKGQAMGLAFSVPETVKAPPSLRNIFKELEAATGKKRSCNKLEDWAKQGVLLLNRSLSVLEGQAGSHEKLGWQDITEELLINFSQAYPECPFILLGNKARALKPKLASTICFEAEHPSPLSAHRGFFGSRIFQKCNEYLIQKGEAPIDWIGDFTETPHTLPL